jgi:hypothetical protein
MEPTKSKLPREAIELYNDFIHGEISRRAFMERRAATCGRSGGSHGYRCVNAKLCAGSAGFPHR